MKKIKVLVSILSLLLTLGITGVNAMGSYSSGYNSPILDNSLNFKAEVKNGRVYTSWDKFSKNESLKYYKLVKSTETSSPVYPDNGYIKYSTDINFTNWIDAGKNYKPTYYRVCAITNEKNRYCSNVVKVDATSNYTTTTSTTSTSTNKLSYNSKIKADKLVDTLIQTLKNKGYSDSTMVSKLDTVISRLKELGNKKPSYKLLTNYLIIKFEEKKMDYQDGFDEIQNLFKDL